MYLGKQRKLNRWPGFDYSSPGLYFVTICTSGRQELFGQIMNDQMLLNETGQIANKFWLEIPKHFVNCELNEFVVMPNHIHGILFIYYKNEDEHRKIVGNAYMRSLRNTKMLLSQIIQLYKAAVTREINKNFDFHFCWQKSFYDRVLRNEKEFKIRREYIANNPINWHKDRNNPINIKK